MSPPAVPPLVVVTDRHVAARAGRDLPTTVASALAGGAPAVLLRDKDLAGPERRRLAATLREMTADAGALLLVASDVALATEVGADGVHLAAADPPADPPAGLVGRSCHDTAEVARARDEAADYAFVSPAAVPVSKPDHGPAIGVDGLAVLVHAAGAMPVLALGGVTPDNVATWRGAGAAGIATLGAVMAAPDPVTATSALLDAWHAAPAPAPSLPPEFP